MKFQDSCREKYPTISPTALLKRRAQQGWTIAEVADDLGIKPWDVYYYIKLYHLQGLFPNNKQSRRAKRHRINGQYLTVKEIAEQHQVSKYAVYQWIKRGKLDAVG